MNLQILSTLGEKNTRFPHVVCLPSPTRACAFGNNSGILQATVNNFLVGVHWIYLSDPIDLF